jgi:hypothetical protein
LHQYSMRNTAQYAEHRMAHGCFEREESGVSEGEPGGDLPPSFVLMVTPSWESSPETRRLALGQR